jgi:hypothetical protein
MMDATTRIAEGGEETDWGYRYEAGEPIDGPFAMLAAFDHVILAGISAMRAEFPEIAERGEWIFETIGDQVARAVLAGVAAAKGIPAGIKDASGTPESS